MKKVTHIVLATVLAIATVGIPMSKHYCMGRLKNVALFTHTEGCMGGDMEQKMPCCEDTQERLNVDELTFNDFEFDSTPDWFEYYAFGYTDEIETDTESTPTRFEYQSNAPPDDLIIVHQVLII